MRPYALTIAGFDPSAGAGLAADLKSFERCGVYGVAVCTANTIQSHHRFLAADWIPLETVLTQLDLLLASYPIAAAKIGIVENGAALAAVLARLSAAGVRQVVWDPVVQPSAGGTLHTAAFTTTFSHSILQQLTLVTPNLAELGFFAQCPEAENSVAHREASLRFAAECSRFCALLCTSAAITPSGVSDLLFLDGAQPHVLESQVTGWAKHGSGCVLSAAITAALAHGATLIDACTQGKRYVEGYLSSSPSLVGYHL
jgi:hydroxymethylpyrimidine/phosphomethylpyrimidine kinase